MTVAVSMLRGINVGSHKRVKMDALRALYDSLGLRYPQTYVQSGNVIFKTSERDMLKVARRIENGIERSFGFRSDVIIRTCPELRDVIARNPFASRTGIDPRKLLVTFLGSNPEPEARDKISKIKADLEELWLDGRELYIYFPNGMGRTKLQLPLLEKTLKTPGTGRNWNSVTKMLAMAEKLEAPER
jgi:uncharacterized protein (DUF1697 family)